MQVFVPIADSGFILDQSTMPDLWRSSTLQEQGNGTKTSHRLREVEGWSTSAGVLFCQQSSLKRPVAETCIEGSGHQCKTSNSSIRVVIVGVEEWRREQDIFSMD